MVAAGVLGAAGGLLAFGAAADVAGRVAPAALTVFVPAGAAAVVVSLVPETRGRELEDWAKD